MVACRLNGAGFGFSVCSGTKWFSLCSSTLFSPFHFSENNCYFLLFLISTLSHLYISQQPTYAVCTNIHKRMHNIIDNYMGSMHRPSFCCVLQTTTVQGCGAILATKVCLYNKILISFGCACT